MPAPHLHFETRQDKPPVFHFTRALITAARRRNKVPAAVKTTLTSDLADLRGLRTAIALITSNDVMVHPKFPRRELAEAAPRLRWIHIIGAGIEPLLPLDWLPDGVILTNNSGVHVQKTGDFAAMALLMLNSRVPQLVTSQAQSKWDQIFTPAIAGKTVAIIGLGDMGGAAAQVAKRMGLQVLGVRRSGAPHRHVDQMYKPDGLRRCLARADFVYVAAPLTPESRHLIDADMLAAAKPGAGLINVGRAGVVDYAALRAALASGALSGAVLDVFDQEPLPASSPLWRTPNLIVMPHCSSDDLDRYLPDTLDLVFQNLARLTAGKALKNRVDPRRGY